MEVLRRILLITAFFAAIVVALFADITPVVLVSPIDFSEKQKQEGSYMGIRIRTERSDRLARMPQDVYINEVTNGSLFTVEGQEWQAVFAAAITVDKRKPLEKKWQKRLPSDKHPVGVLFFKPGEQPINKFAPLFRKSNDQIFLRFRDVEKAIYLKAEFRAYTSDDFHLGSGFSNYPTPPTDFLYPARKWSPWIILVGLAAYIFLPWPKRPADAMVYRRWRVVLCDLVAVILAVPFFAFPFFITGGTIQAFTDRCLLFFIFWPMLSFCFMLVWLAVSSSAFALLPLEDRFRIWHPRGQRDFLYSEMEFFQPVVFKPPKWLVVLSWVAVLAGKGSSMSVAGRALLISSSACGSLAIRLKRGGDVFISITDQMGTDMLNAQHIIDFLKKAGVKEVTEVREIRSLGLELVRLPK